MTSTDSYGRPLHKRLTYGKPPAGKKFFVGNSTFELTEEELKSEPNNLLFRIATTRSTHYGNSEPYLNVDLNIFKLIHAHLQGYEILPLPPQGIPLGYGATDGPLPHLSKDAVLQNLLRDANDFGLKNLVAKLENEMAAPGKADIEEEKQYRLIITAGRGLLSNEGVFITEATKEAILLKLVGTEVEICGPEVPIPNGYTVLVAWNEYSASMVNSRDTANRKKGFVLLESV